MSSRTPARSSKRPQTSRKSPFPNPPTTPPRPSRASQPPPSLPPQLKAGPKRGPDRKRRQSRGKRLLGFGPRLGARFVAGAGEAGRGSLAGPLVVAGVLLDYGEVRGSRVRAAADADDPKAGRGAGPG